MTFSNFNRELKTTESAKHYTERVLAAIPCKLISKYCSYLFFLFRITPNQITVLMMFFGILGSICFALPSCYSKIIGYICFVLWFTMDNSDGEIARITKTFSKYGVEMDFMAHLICHPLMNIAIFLTYWYTGKYNPLILSILFLIFISLELVTRNIIAFQKYLNLNEPGNNVHYKVSMPKYLLLQLLLYPNFILFFTPFIILDYLNIIDTFYFLCGYILYIAIIAIRFFIKTVYTFYK